MIYFNIQNALLEVSVIQCITQRVAAIVWTFIQQSSNYKLFYTKNCFGAYQVRVLPNK